jgi:hypothetical protein
MSITSLRFHWLVDKRERAAKYSQASDPGPIKNLWAYTLLGEANRACLLSLTAEFKGHEVFYIVAPRTAVSELSQDLVHQYYPNVPIRGDLSDNLSFYYCGKAERILGWRHEE